MSGPGPSLALQACPDKPEAPAKDFEPDGLRTNMRIGLVSTLATRVGPHGSGSVEGLVWLLSRELTRMGHAVTVFAAGGSAPCGELVAALPGPYEIGRASCRERVWVSVVVGTG